MILKDKETGMPSLKLKPPVISEVCENNISNAGWILINSPEEVLNIIRLFPEQIPILKSDLDSALSRYGAMIQKYTFRLEIEKHEAEHLKDYMNWLLKLKEDWLNKKVTDHKLICQLFKNDPNYYESLADADFGVIVNEYIDKAIKETNKSTDENKIQQRPSVQASLIDFYILIFKYENGLIF